MELPPLPEPDTHCWDDDSHKDVWSHSDEQLRTYVAAAVAAAIAEEREVCALIAERTFEGASYGQDGDSGYDFMGENSAAAIRARSAPHTQEG